MEQFTTRNLPIGIQSFEKIRERGCVYVDKTQFIPPLLSTGGQYFLSRPRRFGKSLFISTLEEYFLGHRELFTGLALETQEVELAQMQKRESWIERPVFHLDLAGQIYNKKESLETTIKSQLNSWSSKYNLECKEEDIAVRFKEYIIDAYEKTGKQVAVLVDEYDKPLLDNIDNPELLDHYRTILKGFYGVLKPMDKYLHFVFITGITRFDKVSIFSDLNQLRDISTDEKFATICGVTQTELENNFQPDIKTMAEKNELSYDECLAKLKQKYDGYYFHKAVGDNVYNPFSLINALAACDFGDYWFATGTPTFLVKMLKDMNMDINKFFNGVEASRIQFENYHIDTSTPEPLLYQSGYLTIKDYDREFETYTLGFPNKEVEYGFLYQMIPFYIQIKDESLLGMRGFVKDVRGGNVDSFMRRIQAVFAALPPKKSEKFYELDGQQIFFIIFRLMGQFAQCEVQNAEGRTDLVVWTAEIIYVFEFKLDGTADEALAQIDDKNYAVPYQVDGRKVVKVGAVFSSEKCNVTEWKICE